MTDLLFDRYKDALRAGHVAVLRGQLDDALEAYRRAAEVAPTRALPHTSIGGVLLDLGRVDDALDEFRVALGLSPGDETALLGRAEALARAGRPADAAATLDALADSQLDTGRIADAVETLQRALGLEERVGRRRKYQHAVRSLRMQTGERLPEDRAGRGLPSLEAAEAAEPVPEGAAVALQGLEDGEDGGPEGIPAIVAAGAADAAEETPAASDDEPVEEPADEPVEEPADEPVEEPGPPEPEARILGDAALAAAEAATARHDDVAALAGCLEAARIFEEAGLAVAALDACREALAVAPGDIDTHLRYASICRTRGWRDLAQGRLVSVLRLADLDDDVEARARIRAVVEAEFADDEELMGLSA
jgi:hypothetical protein